MVSVSTSTDFLALEAVPYFQLVSLDEHQRGVLIKELRGFSEYLLLNQPNFAISFRSYGNWRQAGCSPLQVGLKLGRANSGPLQIINQLRALKFVAPDGKQAFSAAPSPSKPILRRLRFLPIMVPADMGPGSDYQASNQGPEAAKIAREHLAELEKMGIPANPGLKHPFQAGWRLWGMEPAQGTGARRIVVPASFASDRLGPRDERWRMLLFALGEAALRDEDAEVEIRFSRTSFTPAEAGYLLECYKLFMGTYADDEPDQVLRDFVAAYQPTTLQDRSYTLAIIARGDSAEVLAYSLVQDIDPSVLELAPSEDLIQARTNGVSNTTAAMLEKLQTTWSLTEALEFATFPFSVTDPLPYHPNLVPSPLAAPAIVLTPTAANSHPGPQPGISGAPILLGHLQGTRGHSGEVTLSDGGLSEHTLICGVTGSGKTTTVTSVLQRMYPRLPFLVVDPVKREYSTHFRAWLRSNGGPVAHYNFEGPATGPSWLRFNPFIPPSGINLYAHSALFSRMLATLFPTTGTAFEFVLQMVRRTYYYRHLYRTEGSKRQLNSPHAVEQLRTECLRDAASTPATAWVDLLVNYTGEDLLTKKGLAPNFKDFLAVSKAYLDYKESSTQGNWGREAVEYMRLRNEFLESSLVSFIFSPVNDSTTLEDLGVFDESCIIELYNIVDSGEKNTVFSVLMSLLYEYRLDQWNKETGGKVPTPDGPRAKTKHITVVEEAHRVVAGGDHSGGASIMTSPAQEAATLMAQCLAEIRVMGEGIIVAEQSPSKLIPDVLINTSTKIVHRLFFGPDKESLAAIMGLSPNQADYLSFLQPGEAFSFLKMPEGVFATTHVRVAREDAPK